MRAVSALVFCLPALLTWAACGGAAEDAEEEPAPCTRLFGQPSNHTGLGEDRCAAECECGEQPWSPPNYTASDIEDLRAFRLAGPPKGLAANPYESPVPLAASEGTVCAVRFELEGDQVYQLVTYPTEEQARLDGAYPTHRGPCGLCSSLQNLAVYMEHTDLTEPVRQCGIDGIVSGAEANIECLRAIGFDFPCAQIWYFNTLNTRTHCLDLCLAALDAPHHLDDGSLNPCLQCDEDISGPIFKAIAGRTRRNSGLASGLCRPCASVYRVEHRYR